MTALPFFLVFAAVLQTGCKRHGGQSKHQSAPTTDAATSNLSEEDRFAVVATHLSGAQAKQARALDPAPVEHPLAPPLPPGIVQARFEADTGKDITDGRSPQSGLVLVVRFGAVEKRQTIASCDEVTRGNVLGDTGNDVLDIAACDTLFRLLIRKGEVLVEREPDGGGAPIVVTRLKLPAGVRGDGNSSHPKVK